MFRAGALIVVASRDRGRVTLGLRIPQAIEKLVALRGIEPLFKP
jgi:hypothetical protein